MQWLLSNIAGGAIRWLTAVIIGAICIMWGFAPSTWFVNFIGEPPAWILAPWTRLIIVLAGAAIVILIVHLDRRSKKNAIAAIPQPNWPISDVIDYLVNDSDAVLNQPKEPWIEESGSHKGHRMIEKGVEREDARTKVNERLISGELRIWSLRQMPVMHIANQYEQSKREIKIEYWERMQLDFLSCFYRTVTIPQTTQIPGKQADLQWTGLMLSKEQVLQTWPPRRWWRRIIRKPRITFNSV